MLADCQQREQLISQAIVPLCGKVTPPFTRCYIWPLFLAKVTSKMFGELLVNCFYSCRVFFRLFDGRNAL